MTILGGAIPTSESCRRDDRRGSSCVLFWLWCNLIRQIWEGNVFNPCQVVSSYEWWLHTEFWLILELQLDREALIEFGSLEWKWVIVAGSAACWIWDIIITQEVSESGSEVLWKPAERFCLVWETTIYSFEPIGRLVHNWVPWYDV